MGLWSKKSVFSNYERKLLESIKGICVMEDTFVSIDHNNMDCYVINEAREYRMIIHSSGLIIQNTTDFLIESFQSSFIDECKKHATDRAARDRQKIKGSIEEKKTALADKILSTFFSKEN